MRIGELSRASGVDTETIRYYEKQGLLPCPPRQANGYRAYGSAHLERLAFIRHCRALDMGLSDISRLLSFLQRAPVDCNDVNQLIDEQLVRIRAKLQSIRALEKQLTVLRARCDQGYKTTECGILNELIAAAHGEACACHSMAENRAFENPAAKFAL